VSALLRVAIVDDEALGRLRLAQLVREVSGVDGVNAEVVAELPSADAALRWLDQHAADVLLLDVQMPGLDGTGLAARLKAAGAAPAVVFVTAHAEHALRAFELDAADYLTKPVRRERLCEALARVARRLAKASRGDAAGADTPALVVSERGRLVRVPLTDVLYLKAELKYVTLRTADHTYVLDDALTDIEQRLGDRFLRVHRNAIVAKAAVRALERRASEEEGAEGWAVRIGPVEEWLAVSRRQAGAVREALLAGGL
jgi:two-component system, LytTR family, response regulator AlgR